MSRVDSQIGFRLGSLRCGAGRRLFGKSSLLVSSREDQGYLYAIFSYRLRPHWTAPSPFVINRAPGSRHAGVKAAAQLPDSAAEFSRNTYSASLWIALKDWNERTRKKKVMTPSKRFEQKVSQIRADCVHFPPPAIQVSGQPAVLLSFGDLPGRHSLPRSQCQKFMEGRAKRPESQLTLPSPLFPNFMSMWTHNSSRGVELRSYKTSKHYGGYFVDYFKPIRTPMAVYVQVRATTAPTPRTSVCFMSQPRWEAVPWCPDLDQIHFRTRVHDAITKKLLSSAQSMAPLSRL